MVLQGNKVESQKWLERYGNSLYKYALPRVNDRHVAEDIVQETFLSALNGADGFKGEASEKNWLFTILKNKIIDHYRRKAKEQAIVSMPDLRAVEDDWFNEDGRWEKNKIPKTWRASDNPMERLEIRKVINWCKSHLKEMQQHVFTLKYLEGIDSEEICKVLNISTSNYWVLIHRARLQMRDCVEKTWLQTKDDE